MRAEEDGCKLKRPLILHFGFAEIGGENLQIPRGLNGECWGREHKCLKAMTGDCILAAIPWRLGEIL